MVTYHYVKFYASIIIQLEVININVRNFKFPIGFYSNPHSLWTPKHMALTPFTTNLKTQTEEEQVNIIEPSDPINYSNGLFAPGTDSMDSDAEIENHERRLEQTLLQLKIAKQFCKTDLDDFDYEEDDFEDFFE